MADGGIVTGGGRARRLVLLCAALVMAAVAAMQARVWMQPEAESVGSTATANEPLLGAPAPPADALPETPSFPWPPPRPSAWDVLPEELLRAQGQPPATLGALAKRLAAALDAAGYSQRSFHAVPGGFALVTQLERIAPDGRPAVEARWHVAEDAGTFSLSDYLRRLLYAEPGRFRLVVFAATDRPFSGSGAELTAAEATALLGTGFFTLPAEIAALPLSPAHTCTALIYEFERANDTEPSLVLPSSLPGREHLRQAQIWSAMQDAVATR